MCDLTPALKPRQQLRTCVCAVLLTPSPAGSTCVTDRPKDGANDPFPESDAQGGRAFGRQEGEAILLDKTDGEDFAKEFIDCDQYYDNLRAQASTTLEQRHGAAVFIDDVNCTVSKFFRLVHLER